jgi:hypothetical protein
VTSDASTRPGYQPEPPARWTYILVLLGALHVMLDARYRLVSLFPSRPIGFAFLAATYLTIAFLLPARFPTSLALFSKLEEWADACTSFFLLRKRWTRLTSACLIVVLMTLGGCLVRWIYIARTPITATIADMLPLVQAACVRLASGTNPYGSAYAMPWELPLTLWPGLWLPYMVPHSLALDLRWVHIAVVVCLATLFGLFIVRSTSDLTTRGQATLAASFCALFLFHCHPTDVERKSWNGASNPATRQV